MMEKITYSSDEGFTFEELLEAAKIAEKYFELEDNPEMMQASDENIKYIYDNLHDFLNIIKVNNKVVGSTFIFPCSEKQMSKFISKKISEAQLFEDIMNKPITNFSALYLAGATITPEYRRKGLAFQGFKKTIEKVKTRKITKLLYWPLLEAGERLCRKIAETTKLP